MSLQAIGTRGPNNVTYRLKTDCCDSARWPKFNPRDGHLSSTGNGPTARQRPVQRDRSQPGLEMPILVEETTLLIDWSVTVRRRSVPGLFRRNQVVPSTRASYRAHLPPIYTAPIYTALI